MKKISKIASTLVLGMSFMAPRITLAAGFGKSSLESYKTSLIDIINGILVPGLMSVAFLVFVWGIYKYFFWKGDSDTERATGRTFILYGIVGFVIIFSVWGIITIFKDTLGFGPGSGTMPAPPTFNQTSNPTFNI